MEEPKKKLKAWQWAAIGASTLAFIAAVIWLPWLIEGDRIKDSNGELVPAGGVIITGLRAAFVAIAGGVIAGLALWYTHKKHLLEREQLEEDRQQFAEQYAQAQEQFRLTQEQFRYEQQKDRESTERANRTAATEGYLAAAKLLGSLNLAERLGAVYSLARIAGDSPADRENILGVLGAFRRHRLDDAAACGGERRGAEDLDAVEQVLADLERASPGA